MPFLSDSVVAGPNVFLFGSQALFFDEQAARHLHARLTCDTRHEWLQIVLRELPKLWESFAGFSQQSKYHTTSDILADIDTWLKTGRFTVAAFPLPNSLLTPLVVVSQLIEFGGLIESQLQHPTGHGINIGPSGSHAETFGLCTGLLAAAAVSCSRSGQDIEQYGAVAIRLAMLIGAIADAQDTTKVSENLSKSFSVAWTFPQSCASLEKVLSGFSEAHLSVRVDECRATITAPSDVTTDLQQQLTAAGFVITTLSLRGRFHAKCHTDDLDLLIRFCSLNPGLQFPSTSDLVIPVRTDIRGERVRVSDGELNYIVARSILVDQANWHASFEALTTSTLDSQISLLFCVGSECYIPRVVSQKLGSRVVQAGSMYRKIYDPLDNAVAVIGMSCRVPGANDLDEFWKLLCEPKSQHVPVPEDKFGLQTSWRNHDQRRWYGNFLDQRDSFDHKFFQKSPREMAASDPQHRLMLQVAYQAVEQSGYFNNDKKSKHIGCYIGVANADYERNIACHPANAYSATGNLKSFTSGKINHYFGWTGPSLTIDTACSASTVAIHCACKAILSNECTSALAGGVNMMTSPEWFQNLAGASFLSPTGQCKPFDSKADGYCRAEGVGAVFLKKLSNAVNDGDQIIGIIRGSAVYQNGNCTGITVPNAPSLSNLFRDVIQQAGLYATQISIVEAHAAGTVVGDPIEYDCVRSVCGGPLRTDTLFVSSVKGVIGHAECASGVISLIKTLLMIKNQTITPQAGLQELNPALHYSPDDQIEISTERRLWRSNFRAAMVNNFGASGSNACLIVTEAPRCNQRFGPRESYQLKPNRYPFMFCGANQQSLRNYTTKFLSTVNALTDPAARTIQNLSFQLSRQSNRTLKNALIFSCSSEGQLEQKLRDFETGGESLSVVARQAAKPVIMCFGGQSSTVIGLSQHIYDNTTVLRRHLDECDRACKSIGLVGLYPHIFQQVPIDDTILLQTALFSIQYACAKSWIDCGVEITAVVGLSFGELTALCISGALSLYQAIELVTGRAEIIQRCWGPEKGSMLAVEGNIQDVHGLLTRCDRICGENSSVCIACFNGPQNFTLAGPSRGIELALSIIKDDSSFASLRYKKLSVTHAFHSALTDPLLADLCRAGADFPLKQPAIHFERATETEKDLPSNCSFLAEHMRQPAFYSNAVNRLAQRYPSAIWLEAGTNSSIANLTSRALGSPPDSLFQSVNISNDGAVQSLTDATINLWRQGLNCFFWQHHPLQTSEYHPTLLPPYQFEDHKHWVELKKPLGYADQSDDIKKNPLQRMWTFIGYGDSDNRSARFRINTTSQKYLDLVLGHKVAQSAPICSSTVQLELAVDTLMSLRPEFSNLTYRPEIRQIQNLSPIVLDHSRSFWLNAEAIDDQRLVWHWAIVSGKDDSTLSTHVTGEVRFRSARDPLIAADFAKYGRFISHQRCKQLLEANDADEVMQGQGIYRSFTDILVYGEMYKGLRKIVGKGVGSAGKVSKAWDGDTWVNSGLLDSFCQVAGIYVNNMTDRSDDEMYISTGIEQFIRSPHYYDQDMRSDNWEVYANNHRISPKEFVSDVFIFDARTGALAEIIIGIKYTKVSRTGLGKLVLKLTHGAESKIPLMDDTNTGRSRNSSPLSHASDGVLTPQSSTPIASMTLEVERHRRISRSLGLTQEIFCQVQDILASLSGLDSEEVRLESVLEDIGFDSLMNMELAREIEKTFGRTLSVDYLVDLTTVSKLVDFLQIR